MTSATQAGRTPAKVAKMATQNDVLERGSTDLLGVFGTKAGMSALVRDSGGRVRKVKTGDRLSIGHVRAIDESGVMIERNGQMRRLAFPAG